MQQRDLYEQIEAYLNQELSPEELRAWELRLADDAALRREVEVHRQLQADYDPSRLQLRANLRAIMEEPGPPDAATATGGKTRWMWWLGLAGGLLLAVWGIRQWQRSALTVPETPPAGMPGAPVEKPAAPPDTNPAPPKKEAPIAMSDPARFTPHRGLEAFVNGGVRSESMVIKMTRPVNSTRFMPNEKGAITVHFTGTATWMDDEQPKTLVLLFFNNRDANQPLRSVPVRALKSSPGNITFNISQNLAFPPGLYYFTVEEIDAGEVLYAGKFLIGK